MKECYLFFETLGTRLKIGILIELMESPMCVDELANGLGEERSKVSHALLSLHKCGFVIVEKEGRKRVYSLNKETILPLMRLVEKHVKNYCKVCRKMEVVI